MWYDIGNSTVHIVFTVVDINSQSYDGLFSSSDNAPSAQHISTAMYNTHVSNKLMFYYISKNQLKVINDNYLCNNSNKNHLIHDCIL